jgi:hypothetical protein
VKASKVFPNYHQMIRREIPGITQTCSSQGGAIRDKNIVTSTGDGDSVAALSPSKQVSKPPALLEVCQGINEAASNKLGGDRCLPCILGVLHVGIEIAEYPRVGPRAKANESFIDMM